MTVGKSVGQVLPQFVHDLLRLRVSNIVMTMPPSSRWSLLCAPSLNVAQNRPSPSSERYRIGA